MLMGKFSVKYQNGFQNYRAIFCCDLLQHSHLNYSADKKYAQIERTGTPTKLYPFVVHLNPQPHQENLDKY